MAKQNINVGTAANDKKGDSLRAAFVKVNANFTELYTALGINADGNLNIGAFEFTGSVMSTTDSTAIVIDQATTITSNLSVGGDILPQTANGGNLGSSTLPWRSLYVSNNTIYIGGTAVGVDSQGNLLVGGQSIADVGTPAWANITGKPTFATVATTGAYADLTGRPTSFNSLVTGAYSVNLESGGVLRANVQGIVSDNQLAVEGATLISIQTLDGPYLQLFNQGATKEINLVAWDGESLSAPTWSFDTDRTLTLPNDSSIKSATNIDITIDTPDSSTFNWRFGADGNLAVPGDINLSGGTISQYSQNGLTGLKLVANADQGQNVTIMGTGNNTFPILNYVGTTLSGITIGTPEGDWNFMNGNLTLPGDIKSDSNINIDINLTDSTLRRWQFGEDGELTLPEDAVVKTISGHLTIKGQEYVFIDSATNGQIEIGRSSGVGAVSLGNKSRGTNVVVNDLFVANGVYEFFSSLADATGVVTHNCANGHIFYHTSPDANWTVNLTNLLDTWNRATSVTLIIAQGAIGYYPSAVQIAGVAQTINWQGNATPTPSTNRTDVVTFSIINNSGTYIVLGQLTGF